MLRSLRKQQSLRDHSGLGARKSERASRGWLYIACGRTGGLGLDETRARRAGRAGVGLAGNGGRASGERGRTGGGNGVGLKGNGVGLRGNEVGLEGTGSDWGGRGWTGRMGSDRGDGVGLGGNGVGLGGERVWTGWGTGLD